jgi:hypothetical protein
MSNNKYEQTICPICHEALYNGDAAVLMIKCQHTFHFQCIKDTVAAKNLRCPLCQQDAALAPLFEIPQPAKDQQLLILPGGIKVLRHFLFCMHLCSEV